MLPGRLCRNVSNPSFRNPPPADIRNPVKGQQRHLVSGSPRGRCLDPGSRPPLADLAGMTDFETFSGGRRLLYFRMDTNYDRAPELEAELRAVREGGFSEEFYSIHNRHGGARLSRAHLPEDGPRGRESPRVLPGLPFLTLRWPDTFHTWPLSRRQRIWSAC